MRAQVLLGSILCLSLFMLGCDSQDSQALVADQVPAHTTPGVQSASLDTALAHNTMATFKGTAGIVSRPAQATTVVTLVAVRAARHEHFERVVFEFKDEALPAYHLEYIDRPVRQCGSGEVVPLAGDAWLSIRFSPARGHDDHGHAVLHEREQSPRLPLINEMKATCDFEAEFAWVLGLSRPNPYRVLELTNPTRLVVDIRY